MKMKKAKSKSFGDKKDGMNLTKVLSTSHVNGIGNNSAFIAGLIKRGQRKGSSMGTIENL